jgi:hypothetical protein
MTKSMIFVLTALFAFSTLASAQISTGATVGMSFTTMRGDTPPGTQNTKGLITGVFLEYRLSETLSLQPEILYSQKGAKSVRTSTIQRREFLTNLNYIEVPLLLKLTSRTEEGSVLPGIYAGLAWGYAVLTRTTLEIDGARETEDIGEMIRSTDVGFVLGGEITVPAGSINLGFGIRYTIGLTNISSIGADGRNGALSVMTFVSF